MLKKLLVFGISFMLTYAVLAQSIQSPDAFLGYKIGEQYTPHVSMAAYFKYVAGASKNVKLQQYGTTSEGRPLLVMYVASDENINRLEEIRRNNLRLAGMESSPAAANMPVIVWLSYNVHGNEPASTEAAMLTLFDLVDPANTAAKAWLKNTLVIIDPCVNPDGRDRYVNFYNSVKGAKPNPFLASREHAEPWPGGRVNHYYFDMNRDWAWQTQQEVQARVGLYNQWLPQVHVDYHEQGINAPYYFAPGAEPYHKNITQWQRQFQVAVGKNNAKDFDRNGWLYFTKQEFDLLYPSYGDTYPLYNGSIGMTYEQGGNSGGLAVITRSGDTLTLVQRVAHHHSTGLSTIELISQNAGKLQDEFKKYFVASRANPPGLFKTYVIRNDNNEKTEQLAKLLARNGIQYGYGLVNKSVSGYDYFSGKTASYTVSPNDLVVNAYQPKSVLLNVLLEPNTFVADSTTYDITAWSLPYAYGLRAYGLKESFKPASPAWAVAKPQALVNTHAYAYISAWQSIADARFLSALLNKGIKVRYAEKAFEAGNKKFMPGSLLITRAGNYRADFDQVVTQTAAALGHELTPLASGFVDKGNDLGSDVIHTLKAPRVMVVAGDGVNPEALGEVWHLFEQQLSYPITLVRYQDLGRMRMADFDVAIFPDGRYDDFPSDKLQNWVRDGGKLIAVDNAVALLADKKGFAIKKKDDKAKDKPAQERIYADRDREAVSYTIPGAIFKLNMDNTHPLAFGLPNYYYSLKLNDDIYELMGDDGWNVGTVKKGSYTAGFAGAKAKQKIANGLLLGIQSMGRGSVVYMTDDPLFRSFWENGKLLFCNAVFLVGQ